MANAIVDAVDGLVDALRAAGVEIGSVGGEAFRRTVATRLLSSDFFREARAEAWDEGYDTAISDTEARSAPPGPNGPVDPTFNPYRD